MSDQTVISCDFSKVPKAVELCDCTCKHLVLCFKLMRDVSDMRMQQLMHGVLISFGFRTSFSPGA